ncbi:hypothetical protein DSC45_05850 [Streptomyces sp. YIM 130001]|nr:hypothetical protein DSC45_05850 [Streptomyces sp. YIM 130001]
MDDPVERTDTDGRDDRLPDIDRESLPDTERREDDDREEREERSLAREELLESPPPAVIPVGGDDTMPLGETTGARPQVSQYISPPPTSS